MLCRNDDSILKQYVASASTKYYGNFVLRFGLRQYGDVVVGVFPELEEVVVGDFSLAVSSCKT
jgi:hypothetical protein